MPTLEQLVAVFYKHGSKNMLQVTLEVLPVELAMHSQEVVPPDPNLTSTAVYEISQRITWNGEAAA